MIVVLLERWFRLLFVTPQAKVLTLSHSPARLFEIFHKTRARMHLCNVLDVLRLFRFVRHALSDCCCSGLRVFHSGKFFLVSCAPRSWHPF